MCVLLTGVSGAWGQTSADVKVLTGTTDPSSIGSFSEKSTNYKVWTSSILSNFTISSPDDVLNQASSSYDGYGRCLTVSFSAANVSHEITLTAPSNMIITGYSMKVKGSSSGLTFTMTDEGSTETNIPDQTPYKPSVTFSDTGLSANSTTFTVTSKGKAGTLYISELTLSLQATYGYYTIYKVFYNGAQVANSAFYSMSDVKDTSPSLPSMYKRGYCDYSYYSDAEMTNSLSTITSSNDVIYVNCELKDDTPFDFSTIGAPVWYMIKSGRFLHTYGITCYLANNAGSVSQKSLPLLDNLWAFIGNPYSFKLYNYYQEGYLYCSNVINNGNTLSIDATGSDLTLFENSYSYDTNTGKVDIAFTSDGHGLLNADYTDKILKYVFDTGANVTDAALTNMGWSYFYANNAVVGENFASYINTYITDITPNYEKAGKPGYPKITKSAYTALKTKIDAFNVESSYNRSEYDAFVSAYNDYVSDDDLVLPATGKFYRIKSSPKGSGAANMYLVGTNTTKPGSTSRAAYDGNAGNSASSIWFLNASNQLLNYGNRGYYLVKDGSNNIGNASTVTTGAAISFPVSSPLEFGTLKIKVENSRWLYAQKNGTYYYTDSGGTDPSGNSGYHFYVEEVESLPITFNGEYASFYSPVDLTLPSGVKAYTGKLNGENTVLTLSEVDYVPANTGVILEYAEFSSETSKDFPIRSTVTPVAETSLTGTVAAQSATAGTKLVLGKEDENWGIYAYGSEGTVTLNGFKANMDMPAGGGSVKGFKFSFDDETVIEALTNTLQSTDCTIYNLAGQRINRLQRGVNIVNGKKVLVK